MPGVMVIRPRLALFLSLAAVAACDAIPPYRPSYVADLPPAAPVAVRNIAGLYDLTISAGDTCDSGLPPAVRVRRYAATITQAASRVVVKLAGATFVTPRPGDLGNGFSGRVDGDSVRFSMLGYWDYYWNSWPPPDLGELLPAPTGGSLVISGEVETPITEQGMTGSLDGAFWLFDRTFEWTAPGPWLSPYPASICWSMTHRFTLTPR
jgi:hypothetical protein